MPKDDEDKAVPISITLPSHVLARTDAVAAEQQRSRSNMIAIALVQYLADND